MTAIKGSEITSRHAMREPVDAAPVFKTRMLASADGLSCMDRFWKLIEKINLLHEDYRGQFELEQDRPTRQRNAPRLFDRARHLLKQVNDFLAECGDDIAPIHKKLMNTNKKGLERIRDETGNPFLNIPTITIPSIEWPELPPAIPGPMWNPGWRT